MDLPKHMSLENAALKTIILERPELLEDYIPDPERLIDPSEPLSPSETEYNLMSLYRGLGPSYENQIKYAEKMLKDRSFTLNRIPEKDRTYFLCLEAVKKHPGNILFVPKEQLDEYICLIAVKNDPNLIGAVPPKFRTLPVIKEVMDQNIDSLRNIPVDERTPEICSFIVNQNSLALKFVPEDKRTPEIIKSAIANNGGSIKQISPDKLTDEYIFFALRTDGNNIKFIPRSRITYEMLKVAVETTPSSIKMMVKQGYYGLGPEVEALLNIGLIEIALTKDPELMKYIRWPLIAGTDLPLYMVKKDGLLLRYIPEDRRTPELCWAAVMQNLKAIEYVDYQNVKSSEIFLYVANKDGMALKNCRFVDDLVILVAVEQNPKVIEFFGYKAPDAARYVAVKHDGMLLEYIKFQSQTIAFTAVRQNGLALKYYNSPNSDPKIIYITAVKQNPLAIQFVPEDKRTPEMCLIAVQWKAGLYKFIPDKLKNEDLIKECINANENVTQYIEDEYKTNELLDYIIHKNPSELLRIPPYKMNTKFALLGLEKYGRTFINRIPPALIKKDVKKIIFKLEPSFRHRLSVKMDKDIASFMAEKLRNVSNLPANVKTTEFWENVFRKGPQSFKDVNVFKEPLILEGIDKFGKEFMDRIPVEFKTPNIWDRLIQITPTMLAIPAKTYGEDLGRFVVEMYGPDFVYQGLPDFAKTKEFWKGAIETSWKVLPFIPPKMLDYEMCEIAVKQDPEALNYVPRKKDLLTEDLILLAVKEDESVLEYVDKYFLSPRFFAKAISVNPEVRFYVRGDQEDEVKDILLSDYNLFYEDSWNVMY